MKNKVSINEIVGLIESIYDDEKDFSEERRKNLGDFRILLLKSGISEENVDNFFIFNEGSNVPMRADVYKVKEKLSLDENFLLKLATNLFYAIEVGDQQLMESKLREDGYLFDFKGGKGFYVSGKELFGDSDKQLLEDIFSKGRVIKWYCPLCRKFIDYLDSVEKIEKYLTDFKAGNYKKCDDRHPNKFSIGDGTIICSNFPVSIEKVAVVPKDINKKDVKK